MSLQGDLLARILAAPEDVALRLVYADAISATDSERGELIVVEDQLEAATGELRGLLLGQRATLIREHALRWWPERPTHLFTTSRGFLDSITVDTRADMHALANLAEREPITTLVAIQDPAPIVDGSFRGIRHVEVHGSDQLDRLGDWLAALSGLASIAIHSAEINRYTRVEDRTLRLPTVRRLLLDGYVARYDGGVTPMLEAVASWSALEEVGLARCDLTEAQVLAVCGEDLTKLQRLRLGGNAFTAVGLRALAFAIGQMPALVELDLADATFPAADEQALDAVVDACGTRVQLQRAIVLPAITKFELDGHRVELDAAGGDDYSITLDGQPIPFFYRTQLERRFGPRIKNATHGERAPLLPLVRALASGAPLHDQRGPYDRPTPWVRVSRDETFHLTYLNGQLVIRHHRTERAP